MKATPDEPQSTGNGEQAQAKPVARRRLRQPLTPQPEHVKSEGGDEEAVRILRVPRPAIDEVTQRGPVRPESGAGEQADKDERF